MATDPTASARVAELRNLINGHNHSYYVLNSPTISDFEFDALMRELEDLERSYPDLDDPLSPTHRVGSDLTKGFVQVTHERPMLSLANTYSIDEVNEWVGRVRDGLGGEAFTLTGEMKLDGTSISITYRDGRLVRAVTRGDGTKGDDVTANVKTIRSVPLTVSAPDLPREFEVRGEIVLPWKEFERLNTERAFNEEPLFANPRNAAAGTLKTQNPAEVSRRGLDAYFYYLIGDDLPADNHWDNMQALRRWGFKVSDAMQLLHDIDEVDRYINHWDSARRELPMATDGLVFKVNSLRQQLNLGYTAKSPRWAIAFKFKAERACTPLRFVSYEVGRSGIVTPVANLEPVLLSGTIVKRASLHNADIIRQLDIHQHDHLYVEKGGEIIPKITGVDLAARQPGAEAVGFVTHCPACGTPLERYEGEAAWICPNKYGCPPQIVGRIEHFAGRRMMNIDGIGEETSKLLYDAGLITSAADLYDLRAEQLASLEGFGQTSAKRIIDGIEASKSVPFERVVYALSIPYVGETVARKLARGVETIDNLMTWPAERLQAIDEIGPRIAAAIIDYFAYEPNRRDIERLRRAGVQMAVDESTLAPKSDILAGKTVVISGTFTHHSREQYKEMIEANGGKNSGSISGKTDYLLAGENMGPAKLEKAKRLGVPIISEDEFLAMISPRETT